MNNVFKLTGYDFDKMTKEEVFQAWEYFLNEEKNRKYSPCIDFDCGVTYINNYQCFKLFVDNILNGFIGTVKEYCKKYNVSEKYFNKAHNGEYIIIHKNYIEEEIITEKEIAEIFRIKYSNNTLNWCEIVRNFSSEESNQHAIKL